MLIINPRSGKGAVKNALFDIIDEFTTAGYIVSVFDTKFPGQAVTLAKEHGKKQCCTAFFHQITSRSQYLVYSIL